VGLQGAVPDDQNRLPMQWSADQFAGFSTVKPWKPLGTNWQIYNVEAETGDPASLLSHYRDLIEARNQHAALRVGDLSLLTTGSDALYGILRVSQREAVLVLVNLGAAPVSKYGLSLQQSSLAMGTYTMAPILGEGRFSALEVTLMGGFSGYVPIAEVPPYATLILQLQLGAP
jgi:glycosidase